MARKAMIKQVKMLCMSNKEEIIKNDFSITNFLKMIIMELNLCQKSRHVNNGQFKSKHAVFKITPV